MSGLAAAVRALLVASAAAPLAAACGGPAVTLTVDGDRAVPAELDAICVGVADRSLGGGSFGRTYRLEERLASLPQTLAVEAGGADTALAWVRGYRGGVAVAADVAVLDFGGDVTLRLDRCPRARPGAITPVGTAAVAATTLVASIGHGGTVVVAIDGGAAAMLDDDGAALTTTPLDGGGGDTAIAFDADGDCDDDLAIATAAAVRVLVREGRGFAAGPSFAGAAAMVAFDADRDGDQDLVAGSGGNLVLYRNQGSGSFDAAAPIDHGGAVTAVSALAAGDVDGDGNADLIVGQTGDAPLVLTGNGAGAAGLTPAPAVFPPVTLDVLALVAADADGDLDLDLFVALAGAPARLYINRGGRLEDQSFVRVPQPAVAAATAVAGDWDGDCVPDAALVSTAQTQALHGGADGVFAAETGLAGGSAAVLADLDDDGDPDLLLADGLAEVGWYRR